MNSDDEILAAAREGFLDEAKDMLRQFEEALLSMEQDPGDSEAVNSAFRAAHTIKGTAGLFGFEAVVAFTHEVESVLEAMRSGQLPLSEDGMALLLEGRDQMERLLAEIGQSEPNPDVSALSESLGARLRNHRGAGNPSAGRAVSTGAAASNPAVDVGHEQESSDDAPVWHISIRMGKDALRNGLDPMSFIRYLNTLGQVVGIRTLHESLPDLLGMDAETCYIGFEIRLQTQAQQAAIADVFEFLAEDADIVYLSPQASQDDYRTLLNKRASDETGRESLLAHWQILAGPDAAPFIERRAERQGEDRRHNEPERRAGPRDRRAGDDTRFIRVRADKLDRLIDLIGELVIASSGAQLVAQQEQSPSFIEAAMRIHDLVQEARDGALGLRMVPIGETFARFHRVVRDVSKQLGKEVELHITGGDTELDKSMVETIADPLMHLVRNSLDHGIESSDDRVLAGKSPLGQLALHAYHESGSIVIEVSDDGRGLNRDRILQKAIERELVPPGIELSDEEIYQLIFLPGFSTAEQVTNLSGRGVGMDVVKRNVETLRGQIKVASQPGLGATMQIRLPLTLAIIDGFLTSVGGVSYVLPLELVAECLEAPSEYVADPTKVSGHFDLRGEVVPYLDLGLFYRHQPPKTGRRSLILVHDGLNRIGLIVDRLLGEHQTVIKPLGQVFQQIRGLAGSTILGSGEVALILDVPALLELATNRLSARSSLN
ncbi:MAG: chemotaxis protein CheA [Burkholderiales bacterium]|nr:chemotaxis protein CheA [Burkholderiales bacterium]